MAQQSDLPTTGNPNTSRERRDQKGKLIQRRYLAEMEGRLSTLITTTTTGRDNRTDTTGIGQKILRFDYREGS